MSNPNEDNEPRPGGYSLSGSGPAEPLPAEWARSTDRGARGAGGGTGGGNGFSSSTRIGRIGGWSAAGGNSSSAPRSGGRFATLRDIAGSSAPPMGPGPGGPGGFGMGGSGGDDDDDDDDEAPDGDENDAGENWYAGGERSGISIENPDRRSGNNVVRDILRKAAESGAAASRGPSGPFSGPAYTLGSDEVESSFIPDPNAPQGNAFTPPAGNFGSPTNQVYPAAPGHPPEDQEVATRHITFWRDGFSVENGPLLRYDEPANSQLLDEINAGHAPPQILNVRIGQPVELRVMRRLNEDYVPPPMRPIGTFEGQGHRLGAAVPDVVGAPTSSSSLSHALNLPGIPGAFPTGSNTDSVERSSIQTQFEVDQSLPTTSVQVRLADGTRLVARMNLHHTVGDIRNFINASRPGSSNTPYTIQTTFPNRILEDATQTIEQAGLKNSVVVQRLL